ncbi:MAG: hypothetical protein NVS2B12_18150 [Ktedonobacteraceae bacterium]
MSHHFELLGLALFGILTMIFWVAMLIDCAKNPRLQAGAKVGWLLVVILANWVGALIYFFAGRARNQTTFMHPRSQSFAKPYQQSDRQPIYYQPPVNESHREYQQGYGMVPAERQQNVDKAPNWQHYEEPQSAYPQLPQHELPPQGQQE